MVSHGALGNFLLAMRERFPLRPGDRLLAVTTIGFDIAALELYLPLIGGAAVVIAGREQVQDPPALLALLAVSGARRAAGDADAVAGAVAAAAAPSAPSAGAG